MRHVTVSFILCTRGVARKGWRARSGRRGGAGSAELIIVLPGALAEIVAVVALPPSSASPCCGLKYGLPEVVAALPAAALAPLGVGPGHSGCGPGPGVRAAADRGLPGGDPAARPPRRGRPASSVRCSRCGLGCRSCGEPSG